MDDRLALIGRIAGGIAHDLNNYLAVVDVSLSLLYARVEDPRHRQEVIHARGATQSAIRLVSTLVEYARGGVPASTDVDLVALVRRVIELFGRLVPSQVALSVEVDGAPATVRGVAVELEQVVLNLLVNACDAMPQGGDLLIAVRAGTDGSTELEVSDNGTGIGDAASCVGATSVSTKAGRAGVGLGLGIVRAVADRHAATVRAEQSASGGTRVLVTFNT